MPPIANTYTPHHELHPTLLCTLSPSPHPSAPHQHSYATQSTPHLIQQHPLLITPSFLPLTPIPFPHSPPSPSHPPTHPHPLPPLTPIPIPFPHSPPSPSPTHSTQLLCQTFKDYLRDQGVSPDVLADLLEFYSAFEQHCYTEEFLKGVRTFLDGTN